MSMRYKGATLSATAPVTTGGESGTAPGAWTLEQQAQAQAAGLWPLGPQPKYIEDVFSTYLYTGNGSTQTITNGIDLLGQGGLVWIKNRVSSDFRPILTDTARGVNSQLFSDTDSSAPALTNVITAFNATGFNLGSFVGSNTNANANVSWTWRKQPKFFDIQTWTGTGANTTIAHSLGSVPGCIIVKRIDDFFNWQVYHRSLANTQYMVLNSTAAVATGATRWNSTTPTSTVFSLGTDASVNASGGTYVAYLFAHDAGGFGLAGTDNVISCGSFTTDGSGNATVNLGYEPQWVLMKQASPNTGDWFIFDNMRGMPVRLTGGAFLSPNLSSAEDTTGVCQAQSTGFLFNGSYVPGSNNSATFIYIAIRRGPMKVPTDATKVFKPLTRTGNATVTAITGVGFSPDLTTFQQRNGDNNGALWFDRLRGVTRKLTVNSTAAESAPAGSIVSYDMDGITVGDNSGGNTTNWDTFTYSNLFFKRAPSFFDEVCYTGTGSATTVAHNLAKVPELMIVKSRSASANWNVYAAPIWQGSGNFNVLTLNSTSPDGTYNNTIFNSTAPTASVFSIGSVAGTINDSGATYVAYLFATCLGVSKVGSYTGNGTTQTINCGFAGGARFVLIKRTDATGDWYVWDSARGMVSGTDPSLLLNSTAAEVNANSIYAITTGFQIVSTAAGINASGGTYIFLAIA